MVPRWSLRRSSSFKMSMSVLLLMRIFLLRSDALFPVLFARLKFLQEVFPVLFVVDFFFAQNLPVRRGDNHLVDMGPNQGVPSDLDARQFPGRVNNFVQVFAIFHGVESNVLGSSRLPELPLLVSMADVFVDLDV